MRKNKYIVCTHGDRILGNNGKILVELSAHIRIITWTPQQFSMSWLAEDPRQQCEKVGIILYRVCTWINCREKILSKAGTLFLFLGCWCTRTTTAALGESRINDEVYENFPEHFSQVYAFLNFKNDRLMPYFPLLFRLRLCLVVCISLLSFCETLTATNVGLMRKKINVRPRGKIENDFLVRVETWILISGN